MWCGDVVNGSLLYYSYAMIDSEGFIRSCFLQLFNFYFHSNYQLFFVSLYYLIVNT